MLLEAPSLNVNLGDRKRYTALHWAVSTNNTGAVSQLLLAPGTDPTLVTEMGDSVLHLAVKEGHTILTATLLKSLSASACSTVLATTNRAGATALDLARSYGMTAVIDLLSSADAASEPLVPDRPKYPVVAVEDNFDDPSLSPQEREHLRHDARKNRHTEYMRQKRDAERLFKQRVEANVATLSLQNLQLRAQVQQMRQQAVALRKVAGQHLVSQHV